MSKWKPMWTALSAPYRRLRPPPQDSAAYQIAYLLVAGVGVATLWANYGPPEGTAWWTARASAWLFIVAGGVGAVSLWPGLWFAERGVIQGIWLGALARALLVLGSPTDPADEWAHVLILAAVAVLLVPRYRHISGPTLAPARGAPGST